MCGVPWQETEAAAKKLQSNEKRKLQAFEAFTTQTLQDAQKCAYTLNLGRHQEPKYAVLTFDIAIFFTFQ